LQSDGPGREPPGQSLGALRGAWQCLGMVPGLVRTLQQRAAVRSRGACIRRGACAARRELVRRGAEPALRVPRPLRSRRPPPPRRFPACPWSRIIVSEQGGELEHRHGQGPQSKFYPQGSGGHEALGVLGALARAVRASESEALPLVGRERQS
jgi:hypothetical protein